jgi:hypothetical protein
MPFNFDFSLAQGDMHTAEISPKGWNGPLTIEYIVAQAHKFDTMVSVVWRVKGVDHCFTIPEQRINQLSHGNYAEHFTKALEAFRLDYLSWFRDEQYKDCQWKYDYQRIFGKHIIPDKDN